MTSLPLSTRNDPRPRRRAELLDLHPSVASFRDEVLAGLRSTPKSISPKYFYDARGSELFERITRLPEYYPTRVEIGLLESRTEELAALLGERWELIELGSGSSRKTRILLDAASGRGSYLPVDISKDHLVDAAGQIAQEYPGVRVVAVCADYTRRLPLERLDPRARRIVFFPGSTIGNFEPPAAAEFLGNIATLLGDGDRVIIGVDLQKSPAILHAAYNDAAGVTAKFNLNLLQRINRELGANFDLRRFEHVALYDVTAGRIEMHLRSIGRQTVRIGPLEIDIEDREMIHTENSYKYTREAFAGLAKGAGLEPSEVWTDPELLFSIWVLEPQRS
ncbi:MAG TPA: L-histidine N(alpha)-methyltransferase [Thermoanaerobaculia bacterium]|nr:L-histidine N(alpha)-methyltransferase [Thermoanaerobaculia bacterium]